jgi:hypothetical protein
MSKTKVLKEFGTSIAVAYPKPEYPQDLIDQIVMPALRRSYDKARRDDWRLAKDTTARFTVKYGPRFDVQEHVNGEPCDNQPDMRGCDWCLAKVPLVTTGYVFQYGWYAAIQVDQED